MKRSTSTLSVFLLVLLLTLTLAVAATGCGEATTTETTVASTQTTAPGTETTAAPTETTVPEAQPVNGGTMNVLISEFPTVLGNIQNWSAPKSSMSACLEQLATYDLQGNLVPVLATSWDVDPVAKTITIHLREGVKFHDGTDFDADAAKWNYDLWLQSKKLAGRELVTSCDVVDKYTMRLSLSAYSAMYLTSYLQYPYFFSPTYVEAVGLDESALNPVGTGPFKLESIQPGSSMKYVKFEDYWQEGLPYLDAYEYTQIGDKTTGAMMLESGQADMMVAVAPKDVGAFIDKGYGYFLNPGFIYNLYPNSSDPNNPLSKLEVRQAIECALDREAIAQALGYGYAETLDAFVPKSTIIYPDGYEARTYDPAKAKELLTAAGYPDGFETSLIVRNDDVHRDFATAVQGYLADVGIKLNIDIADTARFNSYQMGEAPFEGLYLSQTRLEPGEAFVQGLLRDVNPKGVCPGTVRSPALAAIYDQLIVAADDASLISLGKQFAKQASDDVMTIPVCTMPNLIVFRPGVHTTYMMAGGNFNVYEDWKEQ